MCLRKPALDPNTLEPGESRYRSSRPANMVRVASLKGKAIVDRRNGANHIYFVTDIVQNKINCNHLRP